MMTSHKNDEWGAGNKLIITRYWFPFLFLMRND
ncbi:Uncharacterised protein [Serratia plymuthica]|nr:Uncharacterised protein [Serratia plymuthica]